MNENSLKDVFLIETGKANMWLVYAPLKMALFAVNDIGARAFRDLQNGLVLTGPNPLLETLKATGLLDGDQFENVLPKTSIAPHADITICPTFRCSLACLYCFARGGERQDDLPLEAALRAIDLALKRGKQGGVRKSRLTWHGGGEPTIAWAILTEASGYYRLKCESIEVEPNIFIVSNGVWSRKVLSWMVTNAKRVIISCDGPSDIQNRQRPKQNGLPSAPSVYRTLQKLHDLDVNFGIRATITEFNVNRMPEMVQFFHDLCQSKSLQFERLAVCGRCEDSGVSAGTASDYIVSFKEAHKVATGLGINLSCSGVNIFNKTALYCGVCGRTLCVTPDGLLTTCHRVDSVENPLGAQFIYGCWDGNTFTYQQEKLVALSGMSVYNFPWCSDCFCKFTCAGGCAAARFADTGSLFGQFQDERCRITRELTMHRLVSVAEKRSLFNSLS